MSIIFVVAMAMAASNVQTVSVPPIEARPPTEQADTESPEEIAEDAARDLKDSRFYNKVGATRADYDAAWQECRLIARGSRTPGGVVTTFYNPAVISPVAAGVAGGIGGMIGGAIVQGQIRRTNRMSCLLVRGWRLVTVPDAERARIAALTDSERDTYFASVVGAKTPPGEIQVWENDFAAPQLAAEAEQ